MQFSKTFTTFFLSLFLSLFASLMPAQQATAAEKNDKDGGYINMEAFTVNLAGLNKYLQVGLTLQGGSPDAGTAVATFMPKVRHEVILLLSSQDAAEILTPKGKVRLAGSIKDAVNNAIELSGSHGITGVLFSSFIIQ